MYKLLLDRQGGSGVISQDIKANHFFYSSNNILKINGINCFVLVPDSDTTTILLKQIIDYIYFEYDKQNKLFFYNYASKEILNFHKNIGKDIEKVISKNYKKISQIFFSKESFKIAGKILKNETGKKLLLITAIKTKEEEIVLLPEKILIDIYKNLNNYLY